MGGVPVGVRFYDTDLLVLKVGLGEKVRHVGVGPPTHDYGCRRVSTRETSLWTTLHRVLRTMERDRTRRVPVTD